MAVFPGLADLADFPARDQAGVDHGHIGAGGKAQLGGGDLRGGRLAMRLPLTNTIFLKPWWISDSPMSTITLISVSGRKVSAPQ